MIPELRARVSLLNPVHFLALGFGSGLAKFMPGTFGTLAAVPLVLISATSLDVSSYIALTLIVSVMGIVLCGKTAQDMQVHDHSAIVWDEVAGLFITLIAVPISWQTMVLGFLLFRLFDIVKPWPISFVDKHVHGGFGIMLDDIIAGVFALTTMHLVLYFNWI